MHTATTAAIPLAHICAYAAYTDTFKEERAQTHGRIHQIVRRSSNVALSLSSTFLYIIFKLCLSLSLPLFLFHLPRCLSIVRQLQTPLPPKLNFSRIALSTPCARAPEHTPDNVSTLTHPLPQILLDLPLHVSVGVRLALLEENG